VANGANVAMRLGTRKFFLSHRRTRRLSGGSVKGDRRVLRKV